MTGPKFFQTRMGTRFFEIDVPAAIRAVVRLAEAVEDHAKPLLNRKLSVEAEKRWRREEGLGRSLTYEDGVEAVLSDVANLVNGDAPGDEADPWVAELRRLLAGRLPLQKKRG